MEWLAYALIGSVAGFFAGLLGIGGGVIIVPLLIFIFTTLLAFDSSYVTHLAIGTSLAIIVMTASVSASTHARQKTVQWRFVLLFAIGTMLGSSIGVRLAIVISADGLRLLLSLFLLIMAIRMLIKREPHSTDQPTIKPFARKIIPVTVIIGIFSAILGIGGGVMMVPYLHRYGLSIKQAISTSAVVNLPLALAATASYIIVGWDNTQLPVATWGFVYLPALVGVATFSFISAYFGARATAYLPAQLLQRIFGLLMLCVALRLLWLSL